MALDDTIDVTQDDDSLEGLTADDGGGSSGADLSGASAPTSVLGSFLSDRGYEVPEGATDDDLFGHIQGWAKRASALPDDLDPEELVRVHGEYSQHREEFAKWRQSQQQAPVQQPAPQPVAQPVTTPQQQAAAGLDHNQVEMFKQVCVWDPENQVYKPKIPGFESQAAKLNELAYQRRQNLERLSEDPDAYIQTRAEKIAEAKANAIVEARMKELMPDIESWREYQARQAEEQFIGPIRSRLVETDATTGKETLTPQGRAFQEAYASAPESLTQLEKLTWAKNQSEAWAAQQAAAPVAKPGFTLRPVAAKQPAQQQAAAPVQQPPVDKKKTFVDAGRHQSRDPNSGQFVPDRSGLVNAALNNGEPNSKDRNFAQIYKDLQKNGHAAEN